MSNTDFYSGKRHKRTANALFSICFYGLFIHFSWSLLGSWFASLPVLLLSRRHFSYSLCRIFWTEPRTRRFLHQPWAPATCCVAPELWEGWQPKSSIFPRLASTQPQLTPPSLQRRLARLSDRFIRSKTPKNASVGGSLSPQKHFLWSDSNRWLWRPARTQDGWYFRSLSEDLRRHWWKVLRREGKLTMMLHFLDVCLLIYLVGLCWGNGINVLLRRLIFSSPEVDVQSFPWEKALVFFF